MLFQFRNVYELYEDDRGGISYFFSLPFFVEERRTQMRLLMMMEAILLILLSFRGAQK